MHMEIISGMKSRIEYKNLEKDFVILDVDRTIINTTSWYHACKCPDLLIAQSNVNKFLAMNDEAYAEGNRSTQVRFRNNTLELIENRINKKFIEKIETFSNISKLPGLSKYFAEGDYTGHLRYYAAGLYVSYNFVEIYDNAIKFIEFCSRYYGNNLKILFLSAGYSSFINGVVDGIFAQKSLKEIDYSVIGSELKIVDGISREVFHMSQFEKKNVVKEIISSGAKIRFLADDSDEDNSLFTIVQDQGGIALKVNHIHNQRESKSWNDFIKLITQEKIKEILQKDELIHSLKNHPVCEMSFLQRAIKDTNEIGIISISLVDFNNGLKKLIDKFILDSNKDKFNRIMNELIFVKEDKVFFRGYLYYNWLPPYIRSDYRTINERWQDLMRKSINSFEILIKEEIFNNKTRLSYVEQLVVYSTIDHLVEAIFYILNLYEQHTLNVVEESDYLWLNNFEQIVCIAEKLSDLVYLYISGKDVGDLCHEIVNNLKELQIVDRIPRVSKHYKYNRELDNNLSIYNFIKYIADESQKNNINFDYIIAFPYGGISLGHAFRSYAKFNLNDAGMPVVVNCHYSSKQSLRKQKMENEEELNIFDYIPRQYLNAVSKMKKGNCNILLLDNNVTTYKTLNSCKFFLEQLGNNVYSAVVALNYDNMCNYLLNVPGSEHLSPSWRNVLSYKPIEEYVTAFNTWRTSRKSKILEQIYFDQTPRKLIGTYQKVNNINFILKSCRVHNLYDLNLSIINGYNMIGIHAVYPDRIKYLVNEIKYEPIHSNLEIREECPVALLEIDSIRAMQRYIPSSVKQAIIFEKLIDVETARACCELYNIPNDSMYIQMQYRTNIDNIKEFKKRLCQRIIVSIGLFQDDFYNYFWRFHNILNPETDYILLDCSKHQPDFIAGSGSYNGNIDKVLMLNRLAESMSNNDVPIIIADDTSIEVMQNYLKVLKLHNVKIKGIDMQNCVEIKSNEQRYQMFNSGGDIYQGKIRKSGTLMGEWLEYFKSFVSTTL